MSGIVGVNRAFLRACGVVTLVTILVGGPIVLGTAGSREGALHTDDPWLAMAVDDERVLRPGELVESFESGVERVRVIVSLHESPMIAGFDAWDDSFEEEAMRAEISILQDDTLSRLSAGSFEVRWLYENQPAFAGSVTTRGLVELLEDSDVRTIDPVFEVDADTRQGIPLIRAADLRFQVDGSDLAIAICDTGIDYDHRQLGDGGFPNSKVIGGWDFGDDDPDPIDLHGHGTSVAGVAAGDGNSSGDYAGGVARGARLYALKISGGSSASASSADMVAAWDWCLTHRNDSPGNPIKVVNTSFGGGEHPDLCDDAVPSMAYAANSLRQAGIVVVASSGNDGFCNAIAWPACIGSVMAVGAVYDADIGEGAWCVEPSSCVGNSTTGCESEYSCRDSTTAADRVTCYSNSAATLSVLAPSNDATVPMVGGGYRDDFGGTSTAAPYTAGAVALLQDYAAKYVDGFRMATEVAEVLESTGDRITDPKSGLAVPRVNVQAAVDTLRISGDDCSDPIWVADGSHEYSIVRATTDGPTESCGQIHEDIWFRYRARCNGTLTASLCAGGNYNTKIAVYEGASCPSEPSAIACDEDSCSNGNATVSIATNVGSVYLIRVGGTSHRGTLELSCRATNDYCTTAETVTHGFTSFDTSLATTDGPAEADCGFCCGDDQIRKDVWFRYTAPHSGTINVSLCGSSFDTKLALYRGFDCPTVASAVACNDDSCSSQSEVSLFVEEGDPILIRVGGYDNEAGRGDLRITGGAIFIDQCQGVDGVHTLRVNLDDGVDGGHFVWVDPESTILLEMLRPAAGGNGKFVVHMNAGLPRVWTLLPANLGPSCINFLLAQGGTPISIWNSIGNVDLVGSSNYFGTPIADPGQAPELFLLLHSGDPVNIPPGSTFTLQGVIVNPAASSPRGVSVTNAIGMIVE